jgi:hypothetical protein
MVKKYINYGYFVIGAFCTFSRGFYCFEEICNHCVLHVNVNDVSIWN